MNAAWWKTDSYRSRISARPPGVCFRRRRLRCRLGHRRGHGRRQARLGGAGLREVPRRRCPSRLSAALRYLRAAPAAVRGFSMSAAPCDVGVRTFPPRGVPREIAGNKYWNSVSGFYQALTRKNSRKGFPLVFTRSLKRLPERLTQPGVVSFQRNFAPG